MTYSLVRERDGAGDSGGMSMIAWQETDGSVGYEHNARPRVGAIIRVGSIGSRSFSAQDYWTTTMVTEILEESETSVRFKTTNSIYKWEVF